AIEGLANAVAALPAGALRAFVTALIAYRGAAMLAAGRTAVLARGLLGLVNLRFAAAGAGLAVLTSGLGSMSRNASGAEQALSLFKTTAAGALLGLAAGGPMGFAIGAG